MKNLSKFTFLTLLVFGMLSVQAQDKDNPWAFFIGTNALDSYPTGQDVVTSSGVVSSDNFGDDLFFKTDNWNFISAISTIGVTRYIGDGFSFEVTSSINRIDRLGETTADDLSWVNVDGAFQYNFKNLINGVNWLDPYLGIGAGYYWLDDNGAGTFNTNLGLNFWLNDNIALTLDTTYKVAFEDKNLDFFQHRAGVKFAFGGKDTDGDGVYDKNDDCPDTPGLEEFNGCPDADKDGIKDGDDDCPNTFGLAEYNGCPDADGDGIIDAKDSCPNEAGSKDMNGCPDDDGDGVINKDDNCPNEAGPSSNGGCPWADSDNDGVVDKDDQCPDVKGTASNNGCPEVTQKVQNELNSYAKTINFDTAKSSITKESQEALQAILGIVEKYPNSKFTVEGHTDSVGSAKSNKELSEARALSVKEYLVKNGVEEFRLSSKGYGEEKPIADNNTKAGRAQNRRVEINLVK